jgi:predicted acetyltransferase
MAALRRTPDERGTVIEYMLDDKPISGLGIVDLRMRIGDIPVRCGGIAGVYTKREHQSKGYSRQVLEDSNVFMREAGYHLAALFGIPNYYPKFGYASSLIDCEVTMAVRDAETAPSRYPVREFQPQDARPIAAIYESANQARTGSIVRDLATWTGFRLGSGWTNRVSAFVVLDGEQVIGYASYNLDLRRYGIGELGYTTPAAYSTILAHAAQCALERRLENITLHLPPDDPFLTYARRYGCETKLSYARHSNGMVRIINQSALLGLVQPLFVRRMQTAGLGDWSGTLVFRTDLGEDRLVFGTGGRTLVAELPQWMLAQWMLGYRTVRNTLFESDARADEEALPILEALFPQGYPYIAVSERF